LALVWLQNSLGLPDLITGPSAQSLVHADFSVKQALSTPPFTKPGRCLWGHGPGRVRCVVHSFTSSFWRTETFLGL
jgi:hypothetical protein